MNLFAVGGSKSYTWVTEDISKVVVSDKGVITAKSEGVTKI